MTDNADEPDVIILLTCIFTSIVQTTGVYLTCRSVVGDADLAGANNIAVEGGCEATADGALWTRV